MIGQLNREKARKAIILCAKEGCKFKRSNKNDWCLKHQLCVFIEQVQKSGKKLCANYIRGCRSELDMDSVGKCEDCLKKDRIKYRTIVTSNETREGYTRCGFCLKFVEDAMFIGAKDQITKHCRICRDKMRVTDAHRDKARRNEIARNADKAPNRMLKLYVKSAKKRGLEFGLSLEFFEQNAGVPCHYCGEIPQISHGIDRMCPTVGYIPGNCVACCSMCNYMKGKLGHDAFIQKILHIARHAKDLPGAKYPELFANHYKCSVRYPVYKTRANVAGYTFTISQTQFDEIIRNPCYLCGKENTSIHQNGIDRINNSVGYEIDNLAACCGDCNWIKSDYVLDNVIDKAMAIYHMHKIHV